MVEDKEQELIKELYKRGNYDEIALFIDPGFRVCDILDEYDILTDSEKIITAISYYLYYVNSISMNRDNYDKVIDLKEEMFHLASLEDGIKELFDNNNDYFKKNIEKIVDVDFLKSCTSNSIFYLYQNGFSDLIINNVLNYKINGIYLIENLLSISEFRDKVLNKEFLLHGFNSRYKNFFYNLPDDRKELIGCYGAYVFGNDNYSDETCDRFKNDLRDIFKNNFPFMDNNLLNKIISLYGSVSYDVICFVIDNVNRAKEYLDGIQEIANRFFNKRIEIVLSFCYKYPNLSSKIFKLSKIDSNGIIKINKLAVIDVLEDIDNLSVEEFFISDIDNYSYSFDVDDELNQYNNISPISLKSEVFLYEYYREIARINKNGKWEEYLVKRLHDETLMEIYNTEEKGMDLLYKANINGDILFVTENASLIVWLPPVLTDIQKYIVVDKLNVLKEKKGIEIYLSIANPNKTGSYIYLNNGMPVNLEMAVDSVSRIKTNNDLKIKKKC